jgi:chromosome segregation ATPase
MGKFIYHSNKRTMKPLHAIHRLAIGMLMFLLVITALVVFITDESNYIAPTQQDVAIQQVIDSLTTAHNAELIVREDSIQAAAYSNIALLQAEKDKAQRKATQAEQKLNEQNRTIADLEAQYAEQCGELITGYRERHDTAMNIIAQKKYELVICNAENSKWQTIATSKETEIAALTKTVNTKNQTISIQKDRLTSITNRSDRNFLFRNWKWMFGRWREYMLE